MYAVISELLVLGSAVQNKYCFSLLPSGNLSQLGVLSLRDNKLQYLPSEVGNCLELHVLDVSGNR